MMSTKLAKNQQKDSDEKLFH